MHLLLAYLCSPPEADDPYGSRLPVGMGYLAAAAMAAGHGCRILNAAGPAWTAFEAELAQYPPDVVGLTMYSFNRHDVARAAAFVKKRRPATRIVVGGPHATALGPAVTGRIPQIDRVATGEGEGALVELLGGAKPSTDDLDALGSPGRALRAAGVEDGADFMYLTGSRGCHGHCTFCTSPSFWGATCRSHSPAFLVAEMRFRQDEIGCSFLSYRDDAFSTDRDRALALCRAIAADEDLQVLWDCQCRAEDVDDELARALARSGCRTVQLGVEHGHPDMRRLLGKPPAVEPVLDATAALRRAGVEVFWFLITAIPGETKDHRRATADLVRRGRPHHVGVAPLALYPGTALYRREGKRRGLTDDTWFDDEDGWILALPRAEAEAVARREMQTLSRMTDRHRFTSHELEFDGAWPLTWARAGHLYDEGRPKEALALLERAERERSRYWTARLAAELLLELGHPDGARRHAERACEHLPRCPEAAALARATVRR